MVQLFLVALCLADKIDESPQQTLSNNLAAVIVSGTIAVMAIFLLLYVLHHAVKDIIQRVKELSMKKDKSGERYKFGFDSYDVLEPWHRSILPPSATGEIFQFVTAVRNARGTVHDPAIEEALDELDMLAIKGDPRLSAIISVYKRHPKIRQLERRLSMLLRVETLRLQPPLLPPDAEGSHEQRSQVSRSSAKLSRKSALSKAKTVKFPSSRNGGRHDQSVVFILSYSICNVTHRRFAMCASLCQGTFATFPPSFLRLR